MPLPSHFAEHLITLIGEMRIQSLDSQEARQECMATFQREQMEKVTQPLSPTEKRMFAIAEKVLAQLPNAKPLEQEDRVFVQQNDLPRGQRTLHGILWENLKSSKVFTSEEYTHQGYGAITRFLGAHPRKESALQEFLEECAVQSILDPLVPPPFESIYTLIEKYKLSREDTPNLDDFAVIENPLGDFKAARIVCNTLHKVAQTAISIESYIPECDKSLKFLESILTPSLNTLPARQQQEFVDALNQAKAILTKFYDRLSEANLHDVFPLNISSVALNIESQNLRNAYRKLQNFFVRTQSIHEANRIGELLKSAETMQRLHKATLEAHRLIHMAPNPSEATKNLAFTKHLHQLLKNLQAPLAKNQDALATSLAKVEKEPAVLKRAYQALEKFSGTAEKSAEREEQAILALRSILPLCHLAMYKMEIKSGGEELMLHTSGKSRISNNLKNEKNQLLAQLGKMHFALMEKINDSERDSFKPQGFALEKMLIVMSVLMRVRYSSEILKDIPGLSDAKEAYEDFEAATSVDDMITIAKRYENLALAIGEVLKERLKATQGMFLGETLTEKDGKSLPEVVRENGQLYSPVKQQSNRDYLGILQGYERLQALRHLEKNDNPGLDEAPNPFEEEPPKPEPLAEDPFRAPTPPPLLSAYHAQKNQGAYEDPFADDAAGPPPKPTH